MSDLIINPEPAAASITIEAVVRYTLQGGPKYWETPRPVDTFKAVGVKNEKEALGNSVKWYVMPAGRWAEYADDPYWKIDGKAIDSADDEQTNTVRINWGLIKEGDWVIVADATIAGERKITSRPQRVTSVDEALSGPLLKAFESGEAKKDPYAVIRATKKLVEVLKAAEAYNGWFPTLPPEKQAQHKKDLANWQAYLDSMLALFGDSIGRDIKTYRVDAVFLDRSTQKTSELRVLLVREKQHLASGMGGTLWHLFDWTQTQNPAMCGRYHSALSDPKEAIARVFEQWNAACKYPPGHVEAWLHPSHKPGGVPEGVEQRIRFETGDLTAFDHVKSFLEAIGLVASIVSAIVTMVAPVPGSQVASIALWTSIFSSTASGVLNLATPDKGASDRISDNLFIAGMFFGVAGKLAKAGAPVLKRASGAVEKFAFYGSASVDAVDGIITTAEIAGTIDAILSDPSLTPLDRLSKLSEAVAHAGVSAVSFRGTAKDFANRLNIDHDGSSIEQRIKDLNTPGKEVVLNEPKAEGDVDKARDQTTTVQTQAGKPPKAKKPKPPPKGDKPPSALSRGMRKKDDKLFSKMAKGKYYIFVREGNEASVPYVGKTGDKDVNGQPVRYEGKPETVKAKTAVEGKHKGLACYDPSHFKTHQFLAELPGHPKQLTVDQLMGGKSWKELMYDASSEFSIRYHAYMLKLDKQGLVVRDDDGYVVEHKETRTRYHGDYDLHGVYDKDGKRIDGDAYTDFQSKMNAQLGSELIRHGAHDNWPDVNDPDKAGINWGPQPPVTVYAPDGSITYLGEKVGGANFTARDKALKRSRQQLKAYFVAHGLPWPYEAFEAHARGGAIDPSP